jgi:hypothetical protein
LRVVGTLLLRARTANEGVGCGLSAIQTESSTDRESFIRTSVGCFFRLISRTIKDVIMREKAR